jgi:hypothetical protein
MNKLQFGALASAALVSVMACSAGDGWVDDPLVDEDVTVGEVSQSIAKGKPGAVNGATDYCNNSAAKCVAGEGDCDSNAQCVAPLICANNVGARWGFGPGFDVCEGSFCENTVKDGDETGVDCGGSCAPCSPSASFSKRLGGGSNDYGRSVYARASDGSFVVAGRYYGTANFGGSNVTSNGASDIFVAKYSSTGTHLWTRSFGGTFADGDHEVGTAMDTNGNVVVVGNMGDTVNFGGGALTSAGGYDAFIVVFDTNGTHKWSNVFGGTGLDKFHDVDFDKDGNVVAIGAFNSTTANFGGTALTSAGSFDVAVAKYNGTTGAHVWSKAYGSPGDDQGLDVVVDVDKFSYVVGYFSQTATFGSVQLMSAGGLDMFVARLGATTGGVTFANRYGGAGADQATGVAVDNQRRPYITGHFRRTVNFGGGNVVSPGNDKADAFALALTNTGTFRWVKAFGGTDHDQGTSITANPATGDTAVGGLLRGSASNFAADGSTVTVAGGTDAFVMRLGPTGTVVSTALYGSTGNDVTHGMAYVNGRLLATGWFAGTATFGGSSLTSAGVDDIWLSQLSF